MTRDLVSQDSTSHRSARHGGYVVTYTRKRDPAEAGLATRAQPMTSGESKAVRREGIGKADWEKFMHNLARKLSVGGNVSETEVVARAVEKICEAKWLTSLQLMDVVLLFDSKWRSGLALPMEETSWQGLVLERSLCGAVIDRLASVVKKMRDATKECSLGVRVLACSGAVCKGLVRAKVSCGPCVYVACDGVTLRSVPLRSRETNWCEIGHAARLRVRVVEARDLPRTDSALAGGKSDPYCVVNLAGREHRTAVRKGTLAPKWGDEFVFPAVDGLYGLLQVFLCACLRACAGMLVNE